VRCVLGLAVFGFGITLLLRAELGAAPWDVFHTGVSDRTGIPTGIVIIVTGLALLLLWIPLRERPGLGTLLNATVIGVVVDLTMPLVPVVESLGVRVTMLVAGLVLVAVGSGAYIGAGLGPGPRDGLMTGLAARSVRGRRISIRAARTSVELIVLAVGVALGGAVGVGTAAFAFGIGPLVQLVLPPLTVSELRDPSPPTEVLAAS